METPAVYSSTSYRYIVRQAGVRGGHALVEGTRVGGHDVIGLLQNGETVDSPTDGLRRAVTFLLDHDVPDDVIYSLLALGHDVQKLRDVLTATSADLISDIPQPALTRATLAVFSSPFKGEVREGDGALRGVW